MKGCIVFPLAVLLAHLAGCTAGWVVESGDTNANLYGVFGLPSGEVFAVGEGGTVLIRESGRWRKLDTGTEATLRTVWGFDTEHVLVAGDGCTALEYRGPVEPPEEGEPPPDLVTLLDGGCGDFRDADGDVESKSAFLIAERDNAKWYTGGSLGNGRSFAERVQGVSMQLTDEIYVVGDQGALYRKHEGKWTGQTITTCGIEAEPGQCPEQYQIFPILWDVWVSPQGQGVIVGSSGGIWRYPPPSEGPWEPEHVELLAELYGVSGFVDDQGNHRAYAVGENGNVIRIEPDSVYSDFPGTNEDLHGVWVSPDGKHVYAVGNEGTIVHFSTL
ncbi:MAG: hypothetical protein D6806_14360 [Deltaproteobacteria bacterium]|nr:MAG: hypothetical protein D6806_14360 [Deltaproteobacteria bacterium]